MDIGSIKSTNATGPTGSPGAGHTGLAGEALGDMSGAPIASATGHPPHFLLLPRWGRGEGGYLEVFHHVLLQEEMNDVF